MAFEKKQYFRKSGFQNEQTSQTYKPKRGALKPLMTEEAKQKASIHELSYDFGCRMTRNGIRSGW